MALVCFDLPEMPRPLRRAHHHHGLVMHHHPKPAPTFGCLMGAGSWEGLVIGGSGAPGMAVPEPATWLLLAIGFFAIIGKRQWIRSSQRPKA